MLERFLKSERVRPGTAATAYTALQVLCTAHDAEKKPEKVERHVQERRELDTWTQIDRFIVQ